MTLVEAKKIKNSGIYLILNTKTKHCYIGQAKYIGQRIREHLRSTYNKTRSDYNYPIHRAIRKYGIENFELEVLENCKLKDLNAREQYWVSKFDARKNGYNQTDGGYQSIRFIKLTKEAVSVLIEELKNTNKSFKEIASAFKITQNAVSKINNGLLWHNDNLNYPIRKKARVTISHFNGKAVYQIDPQTGEVVKIFPSINLAAKNFRDFKGAGGSISRCCRNLRKTVYGYKWQLVNISEEDWLKLFEN